jgi:hypothetical protein
MAGHARITIVRISRFQKRREAVSIRTELVHLMQINDGGCFGRTTARAAPPKIQLNGSRKAPK